MGQPLRQFNLEAVLTHGLIFDAIGVCEKAAVACAQLRGRGDEKGADQLAVDAMRNALNEIPMRGKIVIGEGERDEAPMLFIGEEVGMGTGPAVDIALDPLEGTTITAKNLAGAMTTLAMATEGGFLHAPDVYMMKLAVGPEVPEGALDLDLPIKDNLARLAEAKGVSVSDLTVCLLERPRHDQMVHDVRAAGARVALISDGDIAACIAVADPNSGIDMYLGSGGAPEGVLSAAAMRCVGGQIMGRLQFRNDDERERARRAGIRDLDRVYTTHEMAMGHVIFAATGVTTGQLLQGVRYHDGKATTQSIVLDSSTGLMRKVESIYPCYEPLKRG